MPDISHGEQWIRRKSTTKQHPTEVVASASSRKEELNFPAGKSCACDKARIGEQGDFAGKKEPTPRLLRGHFVKIFKAQSGFKEG